MTRLFAWYHLRTHIPVEWEMVVYSLDRIFGSVEFATRGGIQATLQWKRAKVPGSAAPWEWHWDSTKGNLRAQCVIPEEKVRLLWSFPGASEPVARRVVEESGPHPGEQQALTLQGIEALIPDRYRPVEVQLHPANVMLALEGPRQSRIVHRAWGLPEIVLQGQSPQAFFQRLLAAMQFRVQEVEAARVMQLDARKATFTSRGLSPLTRLLFQRAQGVGWIWHDSVSRRLRTLEMLGPKPGPTLTMEECLVLG